MKVLENEPVRAAVFDLDDTLYPERQYVLSGYRAVAEHLRASLKRTERFEDWLWDRFLRGLCRDAFQAASEHFRLGLDAGGVERLVRVYREHRPRIQPYPSAAEFLGRLHGRFRLGLLTDGFLPAQRLKLQALALERFFDAVVFTEEMGRECWKPSAAGFERVRQLLDVPHDTCAYVGDNPSKDFVAPNALGWRTIRWVHPGQVHADKPAPEAGRPQTTVHLPGELYEVLLSRP